MGEVIAPNERVQLISDRRDLLGKPIVKISRDS